MLTGLKAGFARGGKSFPAQSIKLLRFLKMGCRVIFIMKYFLVLSAFLLCACESGVEPETEITSASVEEPSSEAPEPEQKKSSSKAAFFTFTNDFTSLSGERPPIRLVQKGRRKKSFIVPAVQYADVEVGDVLIGGFKVKAGCVEVPEQAFPLLVYICETAKCLKMSERPLGEIIVPSHYNLLGVGGLLAPQINPVSPCSEEFVSYIKDTGYL